jgi:uncharacterized membrane protein (DUF485 family)
MDVTTPSVDWERVERMPEFQELVARRRRFVVPATAFFMFWYFGFVILAGYAEDFMGTSVYEGLTVGYVLALTQFVMVAVLGVWYLRYSERHLDPLRDEVSRKALEVAGEPEPERAGAAAEAGEPRFDREATREAPRPGQRDVPEREVPR